MVVHPVLELYIMEMWQFSESDFSFSQKSIVLKSKVLLRSENIMPTYSSPTDP